ncbi:MAG: hypothetical protein EA362_11935 [Saprospirales bacterium]|nr:MAG: hypothetical protein EA362_11935 [Saprospirales bacterium]
MCTVIYIPKEDGGYLLASSRDEHKDRPNALPPKTKSLYNNEITYPEDPLGKGSWIVQYGSLGLTIMNGAYKPHKRRLPYRFSRGLIPFHYINCKEQSVDFLRDFNVIGIEPFTLLAVDQKGVKEYRWDEDVLDLHTFGRESRIWASAPLYDDQMLNQRRNWFNRFLRKKPDPSPMDVHDFYFKYGNGDKHSGLIINRENGVKTVSISCIEYQKGVPKMHYWKL